MPDFSDLIGRPFVNGGRGPGYDCWGLTMEAFRRYGIELTDYKIDAGDEKAANATASTDILNAGPGGRWKKIIFCIEPPCLVTFQFKEPGVVTHVGTYIGRGRILHVLENKNVCVERALKYQNFIEGYYEYKK